MSSLALTLLCCCSCMLALANALPITSKPLDNNPDHLTWEAAWLAGDSRIGGSGGKAKKITPKSIFIAPQLNGYNGSLCPPDTKIDYNGKCIHVVNINTDDILVTKLQSILGNGGNPPNTGGEQDYDYDYDPSGPFQINLPLSIDLPAESSALKPTEDFYESPFSYGSSTTTKESKTQSPVVTTERESTFLAGTNKQPFDQMAAESHTDISFLTFESLPNGTLSTQLEVDGDNGTVVQQIVLSSTTAAPTTTTLDSIDADSTTSTSTSTVGSTSTDVTSTAIGTTVEEFSTSTTEIASSTESGTTSTIYPSSTTAEKDVSDNAFATTTTQGVNETTDDLDSLKSELADESLILENRGSTTTEMTFTDVSEIDTEIGMLSTGSTTIEDKLKTTTETAEGTTSIETTTMKVLIQTIPPTPQRRVRPSPKPVQIVTPVRTKWYSPPGATPPPFIVASYTQQERTTRATPETTTAAHHRSTEAPLLVINDTEADKKNRDAIHRQEMRDKLRETMDSNNRFVYHHLPASPPSVTSNPASTTSQDYNYIDQLKKINEIVAENKQRHQQAIGGSRIRFPTRDEDQTPAAANNNAVRFPGSVSNRVVQNNNRLPDIFPKKSPDSTTQRPPFWWLPSGWEVDQTGQKPMLLRFWSRMPLVRDQSLTTSTSSSGGGGGGSSSNANKSSSRWRSSPVVAGNTSPSSVAPRGNSRSPSENFYKEVSSQDIYKVLNMHQLKHKR